MAVSPTASWTMVSPEVGDTLGALGHVVLAAAEEAEMAVEPSVDRQVGERVCADVPLPDHRCRVVRLLQHLRATEGPPRADEEGRGQGTAAQMPVRMARGGDLG